MRPRLDRDKLSPRQRLRFEQLESRAMLSITPISAEIPTARPSHDNVAMDAGGHFVIGDAYYPPTGTPSFGLGRNYEGIAMSPDDGFMGYYVPTTSPPAVAQRDAAVQRYGRDGSPLGDPYLVNQDTPGHQRDPAVAIAPNGNYIGAWWDGNAQRVEYRVFSERGPLTGDLEAFPQSFAPAILIGADRDGDFAITTQGSNALYFFSASGESKGAPVELEGSIFNMIVLANGDVIATGSSLRRITPDGTVTEIFPIGPAGLAPMQDGGFLTSRQTNPNELTLTRYNAADQQVSSGTVTTSSNASENYLATDGRSRAVVVYRQFEFNNGRAVLFDLDGVEAITYPTHLRLPGTEKYVPDGGRVVYRPSAMTMDFVGELLNGDPNDPSSATNVANWRLLRNGGDVSSLIASVSVESRGGYGDSATLHFTEQLDQATYEIIASGAIHGATGGAIDGDYDAAPGGDFSASFIVNAPTHSGPERRISERKIGDQRTSPASLANVAMRDDGSFATTWASDGQDGDRWGVYERLFDHNALPLRGDTRVNTTIDGQQRFSTMATSRSGLFVVTWSSDFQEGDGYGVYARSFNANGGPIGDEIQVNQVTAGNQFKSSVAMDDDGDFVVVWESEVQDGFGYGIYARRFNRSGDPLGVEFRVNQTVLSDQKLAGIAMDSDGDFVVTWTSFNQDGSGDGVYARRYDALGNALGSEFRVNTTTLSTQRQARIAMDPEGDFAVVWMSNGQDGDGYGVYGQRFDAAGVPQGSEFRVNQSTAGNQQHPVLDFDDLGNFVVAWASDGPGDSEGGIYARRFTAAGEAEGDEFRVNTTTVGQQTLPSIGVDAAGDFTIVWNSFGQDGDGFGVYAQRFAASSAPIAHAGGPYTMQEGASITLSAAQSTDPDIDDVLTFSWDLNGDGVYGDATGVNPTVTWSQLATLGINDGPALWPNVSVRATDSFGKTNIATTSIQVTDAPSTIVLIGNSAAAEGTPYSLTLGASNDPGADTITAWKVHWGDGQVETFTSAGAKTHVYVDGDANFTISVEVTNEDGTFLAAEKPISVLNVVPQLASVTADATTENTPTILRGQIIDPGVNDSFTMEIYWGDSAEPQFVAIPAGVRTFEIPHLYADDPAGPPPDQYPIDIIIRDGNVLSGTASIRVTVANIAPTAEILGVQTENPVGVPIELSADVFDPGPLDVLTYAWSIQLNGQVLATGDTPNFIYTPQANGVYVVQLKVMDDDAGVSEVSVAINVPGGVTVPGDTNGDGLVDLEDLNNVRNNFGGLGLGDTNGDGFVDLEDLNAVRNNFGGAPSSSLTRVATGASVHPQAVDVLARVLGEKPSATTRVTLLRATADESLFNEVAARLAVTGHKREDSRYR